MYRGRSGPITTMGRAAILGSYGLRKYASYTVILLSSLAILLSSGCGGVTAAKNANTFFASQSTVAFGNVTVGQTGTASLTLQNRGLSTVEIEDLGASGQAFSLAQGTTLPISVAAGASVTVKLQFAPTSSGAASEPLMISSSLSQTPTSIANVSGTGIPAISGLTCSANSVAGIATDSCSVTLNALALSGGFVVNLSSNAAAVTLPSTVTVPASGTTASFTATVAPVSAAQSAVLTAAGSGTTDTFSLSLVPSSGGGTHKVELSWNPSASQNDPIAGYNVYRSANGAGYQLLNSGLDGQAAYTDGSVQSGAVYNYYVESVDTAGTNSAPSNSTTITVP